MNVIVVLFDSLRRDYQGYYPGLNLEGGLSEK